jgi:hypothetical protein
MHELEKLRDKLCEELERYGKEGVSAGSLEVVDKLAHAIKNIDKIIDRDGDGYSNRYYDGSYARRDSMGRYSRRYSRDGMADKLRDMMRDAPDEHAREELRRLADKMESM